MTAPVVKSLGATGASAYVAVGNSCCGHRGRYTLWRLPLNGLSPKLEVLGRELPLADCRRIARKAGAR